MPAESATSRRNSAFQPPSSREQAPDAISCTAEKEAPPALREPRSRSPHSTTEAAKRKSSEAASKPPPASVKGTSRSALSSPSGSFQRSLTVRVSGEPLPEPGRW